jgi:hypothetical protein
MKQPKPKQAIVVLGLYVVSLLLFVMSALIPNTPVLVFSLTYQPLNVATTAIVNEENFLILSALNQTIVLPTFPQGKYRLEITTSGGVVVEALTDTGLATFTLAVGDQSMGLEVDDLIGEYPITWRQPSSLSLTLTLTNFVKINDSLLYGVFVEAIELYQM